MIESDPISLFSFEILCESIIDDTPRNIDIDVECDVTLVKIALIGKVQTFRETFDGSENPLSCQVLILMMLPESRNIFDVSSAAEMAQNKVARKAANVHA